MSHVQLQSARAKKPAQEIYFSGKHTVPLPQRLIEEGKLSKTQASQLMSKAYDVIQNTEAVSTKLGSFPSSNFSRLFPTKQGGSFHPNKTIPLQGIRFTQ